MDSPVCDSDPFVWTRSNVLALSDARCTICWGVGLVPSRPPKRDRACACVLRSIFRRCLDRYQRYRYSSSGPGQMLFGDHKQRGRHFTRGFRREEYLADFELIAKRVLDDQHHRVFRLAFLEDLDWTDGIRLTRLNRGNWFHSVYRIEATLGSAYATMRPYALWPLDEYLGHVISKSARSAVEGFLEIGEERRYESVEMPSIRICKRGDCDRPTHRLGSGLWSDYCSRSCSIFDICKPFYRDRDGLAA